MYEISFRKLPIHNQKKKKKNSKQSKFFFFFVRIDGYNMAYIYIYIYIYILLSIVTLLRVTQCSLSNIEQLNKFLFY